MVKNSPANAGHTGYIPGSGRPLRATERQRKIPHASTVGASAPRACAPKQEETPQWEAGVLQLEKARAEQPRPSTAKNKQTTPLFHCRGCGFDPWSGS